MAIGKFQGEYRFLSNFWLCEVRLGGIVYPSAEHAYQAQKTTDVIVQASFINCATPGEAKRQGRLIELRPDWERFKKRVMLAVLCAKFYQNPYLADLLVQTGDQYLEEGNHWHDNYWGSCSCKQCLGKGDNVLGELLMAVRVVVRPDDMERGGP
jgi:hypothetical protein